MKCLCFISQIYIAFPPKKSQYAMGNASPVTIVLNILQNLGLVKMWDTCILVSVKINSHLDKCFMIVQSFDSVLTLLAVSVQWHCGQSWYNKVRHKWHYMESVRLHGRWVARYNKMVIQQFNRDESWEQWRGAG